MKVKIWNDDNVMYREEFNNELIEIPPHDYVEMQRGAAVKFMGRYVPFKRDGIKGDLGYKMLRMEEDPELKAQSLKQPQTVFCMKCADKFYTETALKRHLEAVHDGEQLEDESEGSITNEKRDKSGRFRKSGK